MVRFKLKREERRKGRLELKGLSEREVKKRKKKFKKLKREKERAEKGVETPIKKSRKGSIWFWIILLAIIAAFVYFRYFRK
ncbi:hypothetical protein KY339_02025 [Candidatus Woesearchaeota archaeon]|nr:hypothetical protein [Candidatus Woesearchaeota archaeon]